MLFDKFLKLVENHLPEYKFIAENAKLFIFDIVPHKALPAALPEWLEPDLFSLPFPVTAVEDKASLMIIMDETKEPAIGLGQKRIVLELIGSKTNLDNFADDANKKMAAKTAFEGEETFVLIESVVDSFAMNGTSVSGIVELRKVTYIQGDQVDRPKLPPSEQKRLWKSASQNIVACMQELIELFHPKYFIMETRPAKETKKKKYPRSHERPIYTIVTAKDFRKKVGLPTGRKQGGHERRAHLRHYSTDGGFYKSDKVITIAANWIGPYEKTIRNKIYRVIL